MALIASSRFEVNQATLVAQFRQGGVVFVWMAGVTRSIRTKAVLYAPVDTGYMRNTLAVATISTASMGLVGLVGTSAKYAPYVHDGTKAHDIVPKNGKFLVFSAHVGPNTRGKSGKQLVFTKLVHHPGTKGQPFLRRAMQETVAVLK